MISHEHRCIFVHIPKTAGNSVNRVFGVGWEDHKDLQRYFDELPPEVFSGYFKFAIVRNPWDRLLSDYNYQLKKSRAAASKLFVFGADGSKRNFAEWAEAALAAPGVYDPQAWGGEVSPGIHRWSPQVDWISVEGRPRTDFVARLESLPEDFRVIRQRLALPPVRLPHRNRRLHWHYSHYYDRTTRELVAAYYARDIERFDYEFENALLRLAFNWPRARRVNGDAPDGPSPDASFAPARADDACTVSFATARPSARSWPRRSGLAMAASVALLLGVFGRLALTGSETNAAPLTPVQQSVRRLLGRSAAPTEGFFARARRATRAVSQLHLRIELAPAATAGVAVTFDDDPADSLLAGLTTEPPAAARSASGTSPRWWIWRNRHRDGS